MKRYKIVDKKQFCIGITTIAAILVMSWFALSYGEIFIKNSAPNPQYSSVNFFSIMMDVIK